MSAKTVGLCCVKGRYRRTIGRFTNAQGKLAPKKFLLGTDKRAAQLANVRLEQLWADVAKGIEASNVERAGVEQHWQKHLKEEEAVAPPLACATPLEPRWDEESLAIAESIRLGTPHVTVPTIDIADATDRHYAQEVARLRSKYPSVSFVPQEAAAFSRGQATFKEDVSRHMNRAVAAAAIAEAALPIEAGQSLHAAIDAYAQWVGENKIKGGTLTAWGKVLSEQVARLKDAHRDVPLTMFDYNALEKIKAHWASRPASKRNGKPLAIDTVRTQLNAARMFVKWLHKNPDWKWRKPDDWEDALKCETPSLMSDDEIAGLQAGPKSFTTEELTTVYRYATDRERIFILLGLNIGAARAECSTLRIDELHLDKQPPCIKRIRRKTRVYGEFRLWPETVVALQWIARERSVVEPAGNKMVILTERGQPLAATRVANQWNGLMKRVRADHPGVRFLPFKFLRKTAAQLIRDVSDGETAGTFLCHGTPVKTDALSDVYSRRDFQKVFDALAKVREQLEPMFRGVGASFDRPRSKGSANITRMQIERVRELHAAGCQPDRIAAEVGISRATAYRRVAELRARATPPLAALETSGTPDVLAVDDAIESR